MVGAVGIFMLLQEKWSKLLQILRQGSGNNGLRKSDSLTRNGGASTAQ